jgi:hypothetical protein
VSDEHVTEEDVNKTFFLSGATDVDWVKAKAILTFVMEKKEIGATMREIRVRLHNFHYCMYFKVVLSVRLVFAAIVIWFSGGSDFHFYFGCV